MDYKTLHSSVHGIFQSRTLEWVAIPFCRGSSQPTDWPWVFHHCRQILYQLSYMRSPKILFSSVQSVMSDFFVIPWTVAHQAALSITNSWGLLKLMSTESVMPSNHLILCRPLLLPSSIFPRIRVFSSESALHITWPKDWSFSFSISPSNEQPGLISFTMDWLDLLAVQGTLKSLPTPQCKSINSSMLSFLYSPTLTSIHDAWKNHSLD